MLSTTPIEQHASAALVALGLKPDLSPQARAVVAALVEHFNQEMYRVASENAAHVDELQAKFAQKKRDAAGVLNAHMVRPTVEDIIAYGVELGLCEIECRKFHDHYESNGWRVGKVPMKQWHNALSGWKRRNETTPSPAALTGAQIGLRRMALTRVEDRIKFIRGQFPLPVNDPMRTEFRHLKQEKSRLLEELGMKI